MEPMQYDYGAPPQPKTSVLAILSLVFAFLCQPVGFVLGIIAMITIGRSQGRVGGMGLAIGGTVASGVMFFFCIPMIAAVAIPGLLRSRIGANESSAIASLKGISVGMEQFRTSNGEYAPLEVLGGFKPAKGGKKYSDNPFIPSVLGRVDGNGVSVKSGYCFKAFVRGPGAFVVYAWPVERNRTGVRTFAVDESGQVYGSKGPTPYSGAGNEPREDAFNPQNWVPVG